MKKYLKDFEVPPKNPSIDALRRWRKLLFLVKNRKRRFQYTADLCKRSEAEIKKQKIKVSYLFFFFFFGFLGSVR
ncbi:hypothetical protein ACLOJK_000360 [Asimina triloba]